MVQERGSELRVETPKPRLLGIDSYSTVVDFMFRITGGTREPPTVVAVTVVFRCLGVPARFCRHSVGVTRSGILSLQ